MIPIVIFMYNSCMYDIDIALDCYMLYIINVYSIFGKSMEKIGI